MVRTTLPTLPLVVFGVIEPALLIWAYIVGMGDPFSYYAAQAPNYPVTATEFQPQALGLTLQMVNVLLLLAPVAVVCCFTTDPLTTRGYLIAVAFADYGHIYGAYRAVGADYFSKPGEWNDMVWGSVGASVVLNVLRWLTVLGAFGKIAAPGGQAKAGPKKRN